MSTQDYLPSKQFVKIVLAIALLIIIVTTSAWALNKKKSTQIAKNTVTQGELSILGEIVEKDSDSDGIPDWEEGLWGTDPLKKETTAGVSDFAYVTSKKQALQKQNGSETGSDEKINETDQFAQEFFTSIFALQQSGNMNATTIDALVNSFFSHIKNTSEPIKYTLKDVHIADSDETKIVYPYLELITKTFNQKKVSDESLMILGLTMYRNDPSRLPELTKMADQYEATEKALAGAVVPIKVSQIHLDLMNIHHTIAENIRAMQTVEDDPLPAITAVAHYEKNIDIMISTLGSLKNYIDSYGKK